MYQTLNIRPPRVTLVQPKACPFCKAIPYWLECEHEVFESGFNSTGWKKVWILHFYHPGMATDKDCILSGMGFSQKELEKWNTRFE